MDRHLLLLVFILVAFFSGIVHSETIQVVTEEYPPYNYQKDSVVAGVSTEVVQMVLDEVGYEASIRIYPWARAYLMASEQKNTIIYSISRTEERENSFKWIGVVAPADNYLYALKKRDDIVVNTLDDARKYVTGTVKNDVADMFLKEKGFKNGENLSQVSHYDLNMKKLLAERIDLWFSAELVAAYLLKKYGYVPEETVQKAYFLDEISQEGLYMAFSINTPDSIVEQYRIALKKMKDDGRYSQILKKHLQ